MIYLRKSFKIRVIIKLTKTITPRETASIKSTLWSKPEIGLDVPKRVKGAKFDIPVPSIIYLGRKLDFSTFNAKTKACSFNITVVYTFSDKEIVGVQRLNVD